MKMTKLERYMISNQLRILEKLYPDEADGFAVQREAIERGYEFLYALGMEHIYDGDDIVSVEESEEVWDTLEMFDAIGRALSKQDPGFADELTLTRFAGYDGNNEGKFMSFTAYTIERLDRFGYIPMEKPGYWNSHIPMRGTYQRMLAVWKGIPAPVRLELSGEQLRSILLASVHASQRNT